MKGAKVDIEKAKRERLCFHCGKPGHQAKFCRARKREAEEERTYYPHVKNWKGTYLSIQCQTRRGI